MSTSTAPYSTWAEFRDYVHSLSDEEIMEWLSGGPDSPDLPTVSLDGSPEPDWLSAYPWIIVYDANWVGGIPEDYLDETGDILYAARSDAVTAEEAASPGTSPEWDPESPFIETWEMPFSRLARWTEFLDMVKPA